MAGLVSILIPAYNAERWIADTIESAVVQTWPKKEIIIVDDGSRDRTLEIAQRFASRNVSIVSQENQGASAARNKAFQLCQGDYIQWLDADDLIAFDKIAMQMALAGECQDKRTLLSSSWAHFMYRASRAHFSPTPLWCDLSPIEWLSRKMGQNLHMSPATWLVSRELTQAAGAWDTRLSFDDDGEYFCRVVVASKGIRFVPSAKTFYRVSGSGSLSDFDESDEKLKSLFLSMQSHVRNLWSLEDSERIRSVCLSYLQRRFFRFYPKQICLVEQLQQLAASLGGTLEYPQLSWKYSWMSKLVGWTLTKRFRYFYNRSKLFVIRSWDRALYCLESRDAIRTSRCFGSNGVGAAREGLALPRTGR